jgi:hypothetical protein
LLSIIRPRWRPCSRLWWPRYTNSELLLFLPKDES